VSFLAQFLPVLLLQMRVSAPAKYDLRGVCCSRFCCSIILVLVAVLLTVITSGASAPILLTQCPSGFWADNSTGKTLCDKGTFTDYMAGALGRTIITEPSDGVVEAVVVIHGRARPRSVALRLEGLDHRWRATAVHVL
jgi:hypothetical protein